jgi:uncharacterized protein with PQ loop repeat
MPLEEITLALFTACNSVRVVAYLPQIHKAATDKNGASSVSFMTWMLFLLAHLSTVGTLDTSKDMTPHFHVWVRSKQPWIIIPPGTPTFDMGTPTLQDWQRLVAPTPQT